MLTAQALSDRARRPPGRPSYFLADADEHDSSSEVPRRPLHVYEGPARCCPEYEMEGEIDAAVFLNSLCAASLHFAADATQRQQAEGLRRLARAGLGPPLTETCPPTRIQPSRPHDPVFPAPGRRRRAALGAHDAAVADAP